MGLAGNISTKIDGILLGPAENGTFVLHDKYVTFKDCKINDLRERLSDAENE